MGYKTYLIDLEFEHRGCWTEATRSKDLFIRNISKDLNYFHESYKSLSIFAGNDLRSFLRFFRSNKIILNTRILSLYNNVALIEFSGILGGTIASLIKRFNGIMISLEIADGVERWRFVLPRARKERVGTLRDSVSSMGNPLRFYVYEPEPGDFTDLYPQLSRHEERALLQALLSGYLDYPKNAKARDVARALGISPATFLYHMRRAERKLIESYLKRRSFLRSPRSRGSLEDL